jgi:hypothetical protein
MRLKINGILVLISTMILVNSACWGALRTWDGGGVNALASNPTNWDGNVAPVTDDHIKLDATTNKNMTWNLNVALASWTQVGYMGTVTIETVYGPAGFTNLSISGNCVISNGVWTQNLNPAVNYESNRLSVTIGGDLIMGTNGGIDVTGRGYTAGKGPSPGGTSGGNGFGGSYGGQSYFSVYLTYGSLSMPSNLGSGGDFSGGGAALLRVAGSTILDGTIKADGQKVTSNYNRGGAGGSVWLTTAMLEGSGTISAQGSYCPSSGYGAGGGRIAVSLTSGESFGNVTMVAYGSTNGNNGAAGTVYRQAASQSPNQGMLLVDNGGKTAGGGASTLISSNVTEASAGLLVIQNKGQFAIQTNCSFILSGHFTNTTQTALIGGNLILGGSGTSIVSSTAGTRFWGLTCTNAGKSIDFAAGTTNWVDGNLLLNGAAGNLIHLNPVTANRWRLILAPRIHNVSYVDAQYSDASGGAKLEAYSSTDLGNNTNWVFIQQAPGATNQWTGFSNTVWGVSTNWTLNRAPVATDYVLIPGSCSKYPTLDAPAILNILDIRPGATVRLGGLNLTVTNRLDCTGILAASTTEIITLMGHADFTGGTFSNALSTLMIGGVKAQSLRLGNNRFHQVTIVNETAPVTFEDSFSATLFQNPRGELTFSAPFTITSASLLSG